MGWLVDARDGFDVLQGRNNFLAPARIFFLCSRSVLLSVLLCSGCPGFSLLLILCNTHNTNMHAPGGIRNRNPSKPAAAGSRHRPLGHWNRQGFEPRFVQPELSHCTHVSTDCKIANKLTSSQFSASAGPTKCMLCATREAHLASFWPKSPCHSRSRPSKKQACFRTENTGYWWSVLGVVNRKCFLLNATNYRHYETKEIFNAVSNIRSAFCA